MGLSDREALPPAPAGSSSAWRLPARTALTRYLLCFDGGGTSALTLSWTGEVLRVLRELAEHKTTMIIVTHEMKFAHDAADRILFMDARCQIVELG